jgi:hypothetical protein
MHVASHARYRTLTITILIAGGMALGGCGTTSGEMAGRGAGQGAAAGAVGGLLSAVIFGGDPVEAAARGAVWGGSVGAVSGAIQGSQIDKQRSAREEQQEIARIKSEIGNDSFAGLEALVDCKHDVALGYSKQAMKARNRDHALAGLWLEVITYADRGDRKTADSLLGNVVSSDPNVSSVSEASKTLDEALEGLLDIRKHYGLATKCRRSA